MTWFRRQAKARGALRVPGGSPGRIAWMSSWDNTVLDVIDSNLRGQVGLRKWNDAATYSVEPAARRRAILDPHDFLRVHGAGSPARHP